MGLTKEEKKALKLAKKLEKIRLQVEAAKLRKQDELARELAAKELHRVEITTKLRKMMFEAKEPVHKQNVEAMCSTLNRTLDKKDHLLDHIMHLRRTGEYQYQLTISRFCEIVADIIGKFLTDLDDMCKDNDMKSKELLRQGEMEKKYIIEYQKHGETHLNLLLYHSHELADSLAWTIRGENFVKTDEDTNTYLSIRDDLQAVLEGLYNYTWEQYKTTLKGYIAGTSANQKQVRILRQKEIWMSDIIASQARKIAASAGIIRRLQIEVVAYESGTKQASFRDRRDRHKRACNHLKQCLIKSLNTDESQLMTLVTMSNEAIKHLENACKKSEKILRMATQCSKYETLYEKVLPYGADLSNNLPVVDASNNKMDVRRNPSEDEIITQALSTTSNLKKLWQRVSKVKLSNKALNKEKILLEFENAELERMLEMGRERKIGPQSSKCQCTSKNSKKSIFHPNAVEGCFEARKFFPTSKVRARKID